LRYVHYEKVHYEKADHPDDCAARCSVLRAAVLPQLGCDQGGV